MYEYHIVASLLRPKRDDLLQSRSSKIFSKIFRKKVMRKRYFSVTNKKEPLLKGEFKT